MHVKHALTLNSFIYKLLKAKLSLKVDYTTNLKLVWILVYKKKSIIKNLGTLYLN